MLRRKRGQKKEEGRGSEKFVGHSLSPLRKEGGGEEKGEGRGGGGERGGWKKGVTLKRPSHIQPHPSNIGGGEVVRRKKKKKKKGGCENDP